MLVAKLLQQPRTRSNAMKHFLHKLSKHVMGILSGFDRIVFRGMLRCVVDAAD